MDPQKTSRPHGVLHLSLPALRKGLEGFQELLGVLVQVLLHQMSDMLSTENVVHNESRGRFIHLFKGDLTLSRQHSRFIFRQHAETVRQEGSSGMSPPIRWRTDEQYPLVFAGGWWS